MKYKRLGDLLVGVGMITEEQLLEALALQKQNKLRLGETLISMGYISEIQMIQALTTQLGLEFIDLEKASIQPQMTQVVTRNIAKQNKVVPVRVQRDTLYLATADPLNFRAIEEVRTATRMRVVPMVSTEEAIDRAIQRLYGNEGASRAIEEMRKEARFSEQQQGSFTTMSVDDDQQSAPIVRLVNSIIERAIVERASDIHMEPEEAELRVRMRIDGVMRNILTVPKDLQASVISRVKVMGNMDITERKIPQDGRANVTIKDKEVDLRISTLPTIFGEKIVIRLLDKDMKLADKEAIGLKNENAERYDSLVNAQSGVILIVGPTGSGKSSTMYTMLLKLNTEEVNLITLEDPVEYQIEGANQVQINEKTGMTFANGLRSILRQDPDIIAVGEIRDGETAEIAMRAAITGHLVLSTIHTSNAAAAIDRLLDVGVEPYLIAGSVRGILSQRLVRRICPNCRKAYTASQVEKENLRLPLRQEYTFYKGEGCSACFHTGYKGRTGVFEVLEIDREVRRAIHEGLTKEILQERIRSTGFVSMEEECRRLVLDGTTTYSEAMKVIESADL